MKCTITKGDRNKILRLVRENNECKICCHSIIGKVFQCQNGHLICFECKEKVTCCPFCKDVRYSRNLALEDIFSNLIVKCKHVGCGFKGKSECMVPHLQTCKFSPFKCHLCQSTIARTHESITNHFKENHNSFIFHVSQDCNHKFSYLYNARDDDRLVNWSPALIHVRTMESPTIIVMMLVSKPSRHVTISLYAIEIPFNSGMDHVRSDRKLGVRFTVKNPNQETSITIKSLPDIKQLKIGHMHFMFDTDGIHPRVDSTKVMEFKLCFFSSVSSGPSTLDL